MKFIKLNGKYFDEHCAPPASFRLAQKSLLKSTPTAFVLNDLAKKYIEASFKSKQASAQLTKRMEYDED